MHREFVAFLGFKVDDANFGVFLQNFAVLGRYLTKVVSGAGSTGNVTTVTAIAGTLFAHAHPGFVVLDFYGDGDFGDVTEGDRVMLRVVETGRARPVFEMELPQR